ncbi:MAG: hypothetical protein ACFCGT_07425 [Sandaracinaceae bacterium]
MRRRRVLRARAAGAAALLVSSVLALLGCSTAVPEGCPEGTVECGDVCAVLDTDQDHCGSCDSPCADGEVCNGDGECAVRCQPGLVLCDGVCTDPMTSATFCGASGDCAGDSAGEACAPGEVCAAGACEASCQPGFVVCDGRCTDPDVDRDFCGALRTCSGGFRGEACVPGEVCSEGMCRLDCTPGQIICDGRCVDPTSDLAYCGASGDCEGDDVGTECGPGLLCAGGECLGSCLPGTLDCDGRCVDPLSDNRYCGAEGSCEGEEAGEECGPGRICAAGSCEANCLPGYVVCGGRCVDPMVERAFCGASGDCAGDNAGEVCAEGQICADGVCALTCPATQVACDGRCIDPRTNRAHCGASRDCLGDDAGVECPAGQVCDRSECEASCQPELVECGGVCIDPDSSRTFCGATGNCRGADAGTVCGLREACVDGVCTPTSCPAGLLECDAFCVDANTDPNFCGATGDCLAANVGEVCSRREACVAGVCTPVGGSSYVFELLDAVDRGTWTASGSHSAANEDMAAGRQSGGLVNAFASFDLTGLAGTAVLSARLRLEITDYDSMDLEETVTVWDVSTAPMTVEMGGSGMPDVFVDLGSGSRYAVGSVVEADEGTVVEFDLRGPVFRDMLDAFGGRFLVGVSLTDLAGTGNERIQFGPDAAPGRFQLAFEYLPSP